MKNTLSRNFWTAVLLAAGLMGGAQAAASADKAAPAAAQKKKTGASGQVRFLPGSEETTAERSRRLKRECRGQVNAGACAGHTR